MCITQVADAVLKGLSSGKILNLFSFFHTDKLKKVLNVCTKYGMLQLQKYWVSALRFLLYQSTL